MPRAAGGRVEQLNMEVAMRMGRAVLGKCADKLCLPCPLLTWQLHHRIISFRDVVLRFCFRICAVRCISVHSTPGIPQKAIGFMKQFWYIAIRGPPTLTDGF